MSNAATKAGPNGAGPNTRLIVLAVGGFLILALVAALALGGGDDDDAGGSDGGDGGGSVEQTAPVEVSGAFLPPYPDTATPGDPLSDPATGAVGPTIVGTDFEGNEVEIGPDSRPKVVLFLAHWCSHCQRELPVAVDLMASDQMPDGLDVYAVSTAYRTDTGAAAPSDWLADEGFTGSVIRDSDQFDAYVSYGGAGFPFAVYLDGDNTVLLRTAGELGADAMAGIWLAIAES